MKQGKIKTKIRPLFYVLAVLALLLIAFFSRTLFDGKTTAQQSDPMNTQDLKKTFSFPIRDEKNEKVGEIKYTIESAEVRDEVFIKGKSARAVNGKDFLILNLKLENNFSKTVKINARDFVRLSKNENQKEWLAPTIHNDPVEVQAISTQPTRVGFVVSETDKKLLLQIGEINGSKQTINLNF